MYIKRYLVSLLTEQQEVSKAPWLLFGHLKIVSFRTSSIPTVFLFFKTVFRETVVI